MTAELLNDELYFFFFLTWRHVGVHQREWSQMTFSPPDWAPGGYKKGEKKKENMSTELVQDNGQGAEKAEWLEFWMRHV